LNAMTTALGIAPSAESPTLRLRRRVPRPKAHLRLEHFPRIARERLLQAPLTVVKVAEDLVHYCVAIVLVAVAGAVLYRTTYDLAMTSAPFAQAATTAVNGVLFAIIIMEVMRTVLAHFDRGGLQLQPFLIIGIISAVREILSVGVHLSLQDTDQSGALATIHLALQELAVNGAVVLGLAAALVLIRRFAGMREAPATGQTGAGV
jgi:uncharacterized membrane protein (DUF373 family)